MKISKDKVVTFHYTAKNESNEEVENSTGHDPVVYLHGQGQILPGVEKALEGRSNGDKFSISLPPAEAYGEIVPDSVERISLKHFEKGKKIKAGEVAMLNTAHGQHPVKVLKVGHTMATVDSNHPLAGMPLTFEIDVQDVRDASPEEIAHGHVHGPGGHHH